MDTKNTTINYELRPTAKEIMMNGINENNCEQVIRLLQSIIQSPYDENLDNIDFCFLLTSLYYSNIDSPILELLKNSVRDRFLYFQLLKVDEDKENDVDNGRWVVKKEIIERPEDGVREIVQFNYNPATGERIELSRHYIKDEYESNIDEIFAELLNEDDSEEVNEL